MKKEPLILCVTNEVASNFTANVLLAMGAKPAMLSEPCEAAELAAIADAALINVGTVTDRQAEVLREAIRVLNAHGTPWVLDPVAVHVLAYRRQLVTEILAARPTLVRGNQDEIAHLRPHGVTTLATGAVDIIVGADGSREEIRGGTPLLQRVTATGCAQGGVCAAYLGQGLTAFEAARAASRLMKRAGERAVGTAHGPGSFSAALLDAIWQLTHEASEE